MNKKIARHSLGATLLLALACFYGSQAVASGTEVPLEGNYSGFAWLEPDFSGAHCMGSGNISHLGLMSTKCDAVFLEYRTMEECTGIGTGWGILNINTAVYTAANGDQLVIVLHSIACEISAGAHYVDTGKWTIDSENSTGRFAGATGAGDFAGEVDFDAGVFHCEIDGAINY